MEQALRIAQEIGNRSFELAVLTDMSKVQRQAGLREQAAESARQAIALCLSSTEPLMPKRAREAVALARDD